MSLKRHIKSLNLKGYTIIKNVISSDECEIYKKLLNSDYKKYHSSYAKFKQKGSSFSKSPDKNTISRDKVVYNLHNKNYRWFKLFEHKKVLRILDYVLKAGSYDNEAPYYLYNISARCPLKGNPGQQLHVDSELPGLNYNIVTNVMWYFDDVDELNGTTIIVPGSHKIKKFAPDDNAKVKKKLYIKAKKGSVLIFNGCLWHGASKKNTDGSRWALVLGYARWFMKPSFDYMFNTPIKLFKKLKKSQKALLGFDLVPPKDEFTRRRRRSDFFEKPISKFN